MMQAEFEKAKVILDDEEAFLCLSIPFKQARKFVCEMKPRKYAVEIKEYRRKRSLDANSYYWVLLGQLAAALKLTNPAAHNLMLRRYGKPEIIEGKLVYVVIPDTEEAEEKALEAETYHIKPTSEVRFGADGASYRTYKMLRGSHTYDSKEMYELIEGIISECKAIGIETMTPDELRKMGVFI